MRANIYDGWTTGLQIFCITAFAEFCLGIPGVSVPVVQEKPKNQSLLEHGRGSFNERVARGYV